MRLTFLAFLCACGLMAQNIVFEGDSLTAGYTLTKSAYNTPSCKTSMADATCQDWPSQLMLMSALRGHALSKNNFAVAGNEISDLQGRYTTSVHPLSPAVTGVPAILFVWVGANDYHGALTAAQIESALTTYWAGAKADGFTLAVSTITDYGADTTAAHEATRQQVNAWIKGQFYTGAYDYLIDTASIFQDAYDPNFFASDHIHINQAAHYLLAKKINGILLGDSVTDPISTLTTQIGTGCCNARGPFTKVLSSLTTGQQNTGFGYGALYLDTTGNSNTAIGFQAGVNNVTGANNTLIGSNTGSNVKGSNNTVIGQGSVTASNTASNNTVVGNGSAAGVTGGSNTVLGASSASSLTSGTNNIAIGYQADVGATSTGAVQIGTGQNTLNNSLQFQAVIVTRTAGTFATLPACNSTIEGSSAPVTDSTTATYAATITGGGSSHVRAYCNGTNWVVD